MDTDNTNKQRRLLHPYCLECKLITEQAGKDWSETTKRCHGIASNDDYKEIADKTGVPLEDVYEAYDSTYWMAQHLDFSPYWYQDRFIKCTSSRRVLRWGRRSGKTQSVVYYLLEKCVKNAGLKVLVVTPMKSQGKEIYDKLIEGLIASGLQDETRFRQTPYYELNFGNGSRIRCFVSGSSSGTNSAVQIRGQEADVIYMDEMDYIDEASFAAIMPILTDPRRHGDVELIVSSTPSGREDTFWKMCHDSAYKEFFYPSTARPDWDKQMEQDARAFVKTENNYLQEYMAEFGIKTDGVFKRSDIVNAMKDYKYHLNTTTEEKYNEWPELKPWGHWMYMMGVDWNGEGNGSRIVILGFDPARYKFIIAYRERIQATEMSLHFAVQRIVELNRSWRPLYVYIDEGFGQMQDEYLRGIGRQAAMDQAGGKDYNHADLTFVTNLRTVGFGKYLEYEAKDPISGNMEKRKLRIKNYLVENLQRMFELNDIYFSILDLELKQQLMGYSIKGKDTHGFLLYEPDKELGDHDLDALMLAAFAFNQQFDPYFQKRFDNNIVLAKRPGSTKFEKPEKDEQEPNQAEDPIGHNLYIENQKTLLKSAKTQPNRALPGRGSIAQGRPQVNRGSRNKWMIKQTRGGVNNYGL